MPAAAHELDLRTLTDHRITVTKGLAHTEPLQVRFQHRLYQRWLSSCRGTLSAQPAGPHPRDRSTRVYPDRGPQLGDRACITGPAMGLSCPRNSGNPSPGPYSRVPPNGRSAQQLSGQSTSAIAIPRALSLARLRQFPQPLTPPLPSRSLHQLFRWVRRGGRIMED
ncbi:hypothetical protein NDU88_003620 [Pleurodeles waltl]|uniref:Uncharacterized protein n=1 Tax=Pleurodeles waltl TaxID=8319 RepID=A0AAV7MV42_PLEWA|nr:hypothetical protein NDU88_003620 [Pleurodeles waltl]